MYNLVVAVMSVALMAIVVSGGANYLAPDWGSRRTSAELATLSYQSFDAALSAYRSANAGALPPNPGGQSSLSSNALPWPVLRPYLGAMGDPTSKVVSLNAFSGMDWYYLADSAGVALCLASRNAAGDAPIPPAVRAGLGASASAATLAFVGRSCLNQDAAALTDAGAFAVTYRIRSGA